MRSRIGLLAAMAVGLACNGAMAQDAGDRPAPQGIRPDLSQAFRTRSPWRLVVTAGPDTTDYGGNDAPGALTLCLREGTDGPCVSAPVTPPIQPSSPDTMAWAPHYLLAAGVVRPRAAPSPLLLLIVTGSLNAGDGDQVVQTQLLTYDTSEP